MRPKISVLLAVIFAATFASALAHWLAGPSKSLTFMLSLLFIALIFTTAYIVAPLEKGAEPALGATSFTKLQWFYVTVAFSLLICFVAVLLLQAKAHGG